MSVQSAEMESKEAINYLLIATVRHRIVLVLVIFSKDTRAILNENVETVFNRSKR